MKKRTLLVLFVSLACGVSLFAQKTTKKKKKTTTTASSRRRNITPPADTSKNIVANKDVSPVIIASKPLATVPDSDDGYLKSIVMTAARPFPIPDANPNNVKFFHRYWRDIDLKDPRNAKFNVPGSTLIDALLKGVKDGRITAYESVQKPENPGSDSFTVPLPYDSLYNSLRVSVLVDSIDKNTGEKVGSKRQLNDFNSNRITGYRIKEDVYMDKRLSRVQTRIIGIAPLIRIIGTSGDTLTTGLGQPACWLKFKQCRAVFATMDISDPDKNLYDVSMDDMFLQRQFNAKIIEESNPLGNRIQDYIKDPAEQEKEAMRIEKKLADYKNNIWKYTTSAALDGSAAAAEAAMMKTSTKKPAKKPAATTSANVPAPVKQ